VPFITSCPSILIGLILFGKILLYLIINLFLLQLLDQLIHVDIRQKIALIRMGECALAAAVGALGATKDSPAILIKKEMHKLGDVVEVNHAFI